MILTIFDVQDVAHDLKLHAKVHVRKLDASETQNPNSKAPLVEPGTPTASEPYQNLENPDMLRGISTQSEASSPTNLQVPASPSAVAATPALSPANAAAQPSESAPATSSPAPATSPAQGGADPKPSASPAP